jgi:hypothetical protein
LDLRIYGSPVDEWIRNLATANSGLLPNFEYREVGAGEELAGLYRTARIGVNLQHDHARGHGLSFRTFDTMACESLLLTHADCKRALGELGFVDGEDYASFATPADLRQKCEEYLADEPRRQALAASAGHKVRAAHTLAHRLAEVFGRFGSPGLREHFLGLSRDVDGPGISRHVRSVPERLPDAASPEEPGLTIASLSAEVAALRASWALRIGNWALAPLRPVKTLLRRAG